MSNTKIQYRLAQPADLKQLVEIGDELFDYPVREDRAIEFLNDPRHLMMLALVSPKVVGMASGFVYVHPDKEPALFIDEVSVIDAHQRNGIGTELVTRLVEEAFTTYECREAWVLTDDANVGAQKAYKRAGGTLHKAGLVMFEYKKKKPI